jgi:hypothetical protein
MKNESKAYRDIVPLIGIALLVIGIARTSQAREFLEKSKFTKIEIPAAFRSGPLLSGINPQGTIVEDYTDNSGIGHGFLLSKGIFTTCNSAQETQFNTAARWRLPSRTSD